MTTEEAGPRQATRFLLLYALAVAGGSIAYIPFLTILLPVRIDGIARGDAVGALAYATFAGAVAASLANIAFGWASDRTRSRRPWIAGGLVLSSILLVAFSRVADVMLLVAMLVAWQLGLNMMLAPLFAWAGDCVPDDQKGVLGGLLAFAPAAGAAAGAVVTWPGLAGADGRLWLVAALVAACVAPVLIFGRPRAMPHLMADDCAGEAAEPVRGRFVEARVVRMWLARLLLQISEAALFAFLYFWFRSVDPAMTDARVARIFGAILAGAVPLALLAGRWADRSGRPFRPMQIAGLMSATGLAIMALSQEIASSIAGYLVFGLAASVFLSLHTAQTLRVLPRARNRGRDLGFFNLTNTGPSLAMPWLTLALVPAFGFTGLFAVLAVCALAASVLLTGLRTGS
ncbi:MFS transporter [Tsuneonella amylolytica]|uniref:MFS transporter n=1 Tax=Tsuneonella amylolytica TaxID=2338327 RepID=UPI000EA8E4DF|nr:MFS transporter [Tsuneonella amylolytica]